MPAQRILKAAIYILFIFLIFSYGVFRLYDLISGPKIQIYYPKNGELVDNVFTVKGRVINADKIHLFDREILTDKEGLFSEVMIANENYTDIKILASNRWKKQSSVSLIVENVNRGR